MLGLVLLLACLLAGAALLRLGGRRHPGGTLGESFTYSLGDLLKTDPALVVCEELAPIPSPVPQPSAIAVDSSNRLVVAGAGQAAVLDAAGAITRRVELGGNATCAAVDESGTLYVGLGDRLAVCGAGDSAAVVTWPSPGPGTVFTSVAARDDDVFAADAGHRAVYRYNARGELLTRIVTNIAERGGGGFIVPSPYFDLAVGGDGSLWVADPGRRRVLNLGDDGRPRSAWGSSSTDAEGFAGCCNPSHFAIRADGFFVTAEKGLPRVKLYGPDGTFAGVVAGPESFESDAAGLDVAVAADGRILVLDPGRQTIRVFRQTRSLPPKKP
jgi:hypothetical protein